MNAQIAFKEGIVEAEKKAAEEQSSTRTWLDAPNPKEREDAGYNKNKIIAQHMSVRAIWSINLLISSVQRLYGGSPACEVCRRDVWRPSMAMVRRERPCN